MLLAAEVGQYRPIRGSPAAAARLAGVPAMSLPPVCGVKAAATVGALLPRHTPIESVGPPRIWLVPAAASGTWMNGVMVSARRAQASASVETAASVYLAKRWAAPGAEADCGQMNSRNPATILVCSTPAVPSPTVAPVS